LPRSASTGKQASDIHTTGSLISPASIQDVMLKEAIECWSSNKYVLCYWLLKYCVMLLCKLLKHNSTEQDGINVKVSLFTPGK